MLRQSRHEREVRAALVEVDDCLAAAVNMRLGIDEDVEDGGAERELAGLSDREVDAIRCGVVLAAEMLARDEVMDSAQAAASVVATAQHNLPRMERLRAAILRAVADGE